MQILQPITGPADVGNGKGLPTPYLNASVEPSVGQIGMALAGFVGAGLFLNSPKFERVSLRELYFVFRLLHENTRIEKNKQTNIILN